jgi:hypothetical protein
MGWKEKLEEFIKGDADEFLTALVLLAVASVGLFVLDKVSFEAWGAVCGGFLAYQSTNRTVRAIKTNGNK